MNVWILKHTIRILINRLVELGSNFIIRKHNIERLLEFGKNIEDFYNEYVNRVKQLIFNSTDEIKCLYLEYLLLYGREYTGDRDCSGSFCFPAGSTRQEECLKRIFLENSRAIINGIQYLCLEKDDEQISIENALNHSYYLENYARFLQFQKIIERKEGAYHFINEEFKKVQGMIRLRKQLDSILNTDNIEQKDIITNEAEDLYRELMNNILASTGAKNGEFIVPYYTDSTSCMTLGLRREDYNNFGDATLKELIDQHRDALKNSTVEFIWDTPAQIPSSKRSVTILVKYGDLKNEGGISEIYLALRFHEIDITKLYIVLKNLLVFRMDIWRIFNLNSNSLLQNWMKDRFYKEQMSKERAQNHSPAEELWDELKYINEQYAKSFYIMDNPLDTTSNMYENKGKNEHLETLTKLFKLTVNCLIGRYNSLLLGGEFEKCAYFKNSSSISITEFWKRDELYFKTAASLWELQLVNQKGAPLCIEHLSGQIPARKINKVLCCPCLEHLRIMILSAIGGLYDHKQGNNKKVMIYTENASLYIKNKLTDDLNVVRKKIEESQKRSGNGISVSVISDICRFFYPEEKQIVYVDEADHTFVVRLPIYNFSESH